MRFSSYMTFIRMIFISTIAVFLFAQLAACASDSYATKGAVRGAGQGAAAGAVGGLVSALVFGGDPLDRAARGAVYGGAAGAVAGGISGSRVDKQVKAQQDAELEALRRELGDDAFKALASLAECRHKRTLKNARKAQQSENPNYRVAGLWLEALNYADMKQQDRVDILLPVIVAEDWEIKSEAHAREATRDAVTELALIRKEYKLPQTCPS